MFKFKNKDTRERLQWRRSGVFIVNFEHISHFVLVFLMLTLSKQMPAVKLLVFNGIVYCDMKYFDA